jgi:hypothetical protein
VVSTLLFDLGLEFRTGRIAAQAMGVSSAIRLIGKPAKPGRMKPR